MLFFHNTQKNPQISQIQLFMTSHLRALNLHPKPRTDGQVRDSLTLPPIEREEMADLTSDYNSFVRSSSVSLLFVSSLGSTNEVLVGAKESHTTTFQGGVKHLLQFTP